MPDDELIEMDDELDEDEELDLDDEDLKEADPFAPEDEEETM
jgi:hypothetical protein